MTEKKSQTCACGRRRYSKHSLCCVCRKQAAKHDTCECGGQKDARSAICLKCKDKACQTRALKFHKLHAEHTLQEIATMHGITKQAVSKTIKKLKEPA